MFVRKTRAPMAMAILVMRASSAQGADVQADSTGITQQTREAAATDSLDAVEAIPFAGRARASCDGDAAEKLGYAHLMGSNGKRDVAEALRWYRVGAEIGNEFAMKNLGFLYEGNMGVEADKDAALEWYQRSALVGYKAARAAVERMGGTVPKAGELPELKRDSTIPDSYYFRVCKERQ